MVSLFEKPSNKIAGTSVTGKMEEFSLFNELHKRYIVIICGTIHATG